MGDYEASEHSDYGGSSFTIFLILILLVLSGDHGFTGLGE